MNASPEQIAVLKGLLALPEEQFAELIEGLTVQTGALALKAEGLGLRYKAGDDEEEAAGDIYEQIDRLVLALEEYAEADEAGARIALKSWASTLAQQVQATGQRQKTISAGGFAGTVALLGL